ncbi:MAG: VacB/RNase II family 3'-5' exoribonuclease [Candidatus Dadabacteria bacterium]|nr:MAG: VacB/RNase II family 3'-5' exoribonuclease [Candidatus Dadabacteria bacterium]
MSTRKSQSESRENIVRGRVDLMPDGVAVLRTRDTPRKPLRLSLEALPEDVVDGDLIEVELRGRKPRFVRVVSREAFEFEGKLERRNGKLYIIPDTEITRAPVFVPRKEHSKVSDCPDGAPVRARMRGVRGRDIRPVAEVVDVLEGQTALERVMDRVCDEYNIRRDFPANVLDEAAALVPRTFEQGDDFVADLRDLPFVTVDGVHARDYDDAIWVRQDGEGFEAIIAIADVSGYIREGSQIDTEAVRRGTSVYFPHRVYPMLPERLSNDLCSLVPKQDRPVMAVRLRFDAEGTRTGAELLEGWIHSHARLTYGGVNNWLADGDIAALGSDVPSQVPDVVRAAHRLAECRWAQRRRRGALDFDLPEPEFVIGLNGEISEILFRDRGPAQRMIEELMIAANEAVGELLTEAGLPVVYRCHAAPPEDKYTFFRQFAHNLGFDVPARPSPEALQEVTLAAAGTPWERAVNVLVLRTMSMAEYSTENIGHFGLSLDHYCHFTSPIRRYPDLINHRWARHYLRRGGMPRRKVEEVRRRLQELARELTERERQAEYAERNFARSLKAQFLAGRTGERFRGVVSGVAKFGIFVELEEYLIDGLVSVRDLGNDYFVFDEQRFELWGRRTGQRFRIGDLVEVTLTGINVEKGHIDFRLEQHDPLSYGRSGS